MTAKCTLVECLNFFDDILTTLRAGFEAVEDTLPKPLMRVRSRNIEFRYEDPDIDLALFLKLARGISLLGGLRIMVERGLAQEQGILKRSIDETNEDILFLSWGHQNGLEEIHHAFLDAFWAEEFQNPADLLSNKRRASIPRKRIQAFNSRQAGVPDPSTAHSIDRLLQGVFSGFVHGASTHILDLYDPHTQRFSISGLRDTPVRDAYVIDSANYPYRVLMSAIMVARKLGLQAIAEGFYLKLKQAEVFVGLPSDEEAAELMKRMRPKTS